MEVSIRQGRALAWTGALGAAYFALACAGLKLVDPDDGAAVVWPAAGLALGVLVVAPRRLWPALAVAILLANLVAQLLLRPSSFGLGSAIAVTGLLQSLGAALVMGAVAGERPRIGSSRTVGGLFAAAGVAGAAAAVIGAAALAIGTDESFGPAFLGWWLGNAIGMLVVAPVVLAIAHPDEVGSNRVEAGALIALTAAVAGLLFLRRPGVGIPVLSFSYLVMPCLLWCAIRAGARAATFASLLVAAVAATATVNDLGPFASARFDVHERAQVLQGFLAIVVLTTLVVGAVVADQRRARAEARTEADRLAAALDDLGSAQEDLRTVFERAPIGHAILDADGTVGEVNAALTAITGYDAAGLRAAGAEVLARPGEELEPLVQLLESIRGGDTCSGELELAIFHRDGHVVEVAIYVAVLAGTRRDAGRTLLQVVDVSARKQVEARLRELADHDPLTGLLNRRSFDKELEAHLARARRYGPDGALIVLDLDDFKHVNDTAGHHVGDELLVSVATLLRRRLRASDVVARLGGDEFAVLLPHADRDAAALIARTLVAGVRDELEVTTSLGVAMVGDDGAATPSDLLIAADRAMYEAKASGRDRHAFFSLVED